MLARTTSDLASPRGVTGSGTAALLRGTLALAALVAGLWRAAAAQQAPASIIGSLVNRDTRLPVEAARVAVLGTNLAVNTGDDGTFRLSGVPPGVRVVQIRAIGFAVSSWLLQLDEGQTVRHEFEMEPRVYELAEVAVSGRDLTNLSWRSEAGFEERRARSGGYFITRQEIAARRAETLADLLRGVPGVNTTCSYRSCQILMMRSPLPCAPDYFLDGHPATLSTGPDFPINQIRGVEVYRSAFETPVQFHRTGQRCGVIAIWTIEPGESLRRPRAPAPPRPDTLPERPREIPDPRVEPPVDP